MALAYIKPADPIIRWAALLHDIGKAFTKSTDEDGIDHFYEHDKAGAYLVTQIGKRLKWSNHRIAYVKNLVYFHLSPRQKQRPIRFFKKFIKPYTDTSIDFQLRQLKDLFLISQADTFAKQGDNTDPEIQELDYKYNIMYEKISDNYGAAKPLLNGFVFMNDFEWQMEQSDNGIEIDEENARKFMETIIDEIAS